MKLLPILICTAIVGGTVTYEHFQNENELAKKKEQQLQAIVRQVSSVNTVSTVSDVVTQALAFKAMLTTTQQATLQQTYTSTLARKWSNLPCGSSCRNGIQFSTLTSTQLAAAKAVVQAALSTSGYNVFSQLLLADDYLNANGGGSGYGSGIYFISFLNTPSTTGAWMLQFGGHHMAYNIAYNNGVVVGTTPNMLGVEPLSFTTNSVTYSPLTSKRDALANFFASLTSTQLATAKLSTTFSDCLMSPGESNGNTNTFPTTKQGLIASGLTTNQQALLTTAMEAWVNDMDATAAATLMTTYNAGINSTYVAYTGSGTSGNASSFLNTNTNYVRIDGPRVWIEFVCQNGLVFPSQIHYHSVWRDHAKDYGADLTSTTLPVSIGSFGALLKDGKRVLNWTSTDELNFDHYEVEFSNNSKDYTTVSKVSAHNQASSYSFTDNVSTVAPINYYRLKMVNKDASFSYSNVVSLRMNKLKAISIYPNPASNAIAILPANEVFGNATISVTDIKGTLVARLANRSGSKVEVNVSSLVAGNYVVQVVDNGVTYTSRFVKQ